MAISMHLVIKLPQLKLLCLWKRYRHILKMQKSMKTYAELQHTYLHNPLVMSRRKDIHLPKPNYQACLRGTKVCLTKFPNRVSRASPVSKSVMQRPLSSDIHHTGRSCPLPGRAEGQVGWIFEQPALVGGVPVHRSWLNLDDL